MKALSIRQPWAWFVTEGFPLKDYENRNWGADYLKAQLTLCPIGSDFLIHASKGMTEKEYDEACAFAFKAGVHVMPQFDNLKRGGIVGIAKLAGVVKGSPSPWFVGPVALKLASAYPLPFIPCAGQLGFFEFTAHSQEQVPFTSETLGEPWKDQGEE